MNPTKITKETVQKSKQGITLYEDGSGRYYTDGIFAIRSPRLDFSEIKKSGIPETASDGSISDFFPKTWDNYLKIEVSLEDLERVVKAASPLWKDWSGTVWREKYQSGRIKRVRKEANSNQTCFEGRDGLIKVTAYNSIMGDFEGQLSYKGLDFPFFAVNGKIFLGLLQLVKSQKNKEVTIYLEKYPEGVPLYLEAGDFTACIMALSPDR